MRNTIIALVALFALLLAAYFYFSTKGYELHFTETELRDRLNEGLPITKRYLFIFEVVLDSPRIKLTEGANRIGAGLNVTLNIQIGDTPLPIEGSVDASGTVRYESSSGEFYLDDPQIEDLAVEGIPGKYTDQIDGLLERVLVEFYSERPLRSE